MVPGQGEFDGLRRERYLERAVQKGSVCLESGNKIICFFSVFLV
jgi:hypothetical protein